MFHRYYSLVSGSYKVGAGQQGGGFAPHKVQGLCFPETLLVYSGGSSKNPSVEQPTHLGFLSPLVSISALWEGQRELGFLLISVCFRETAVK